MATNFNRRCALRHYFFFLLFLLLLKWRLYYSLDFRHSTMKMTLQYSVVECLNTESFFFCSFYSMRIKRCYGYCWTFTKIPFYILFCDCFFFHSLFLFIFFFLYNSFHSKKRTATSHNSFPSSPLPSTILFQIVVLFIQNKKEKKNSSAYNSELVNFSFTAPIFFFFKIDSHKQALLLLSEYKHFR